MADKWPKSHEVFIIPFHPQFFCDRQIFIVFDKDHFDRQRQGKNVANHAHLV